MEIDQIGSPPVAGRVGLPIKLGREILWPDGLVKNIQNVFFLKKFSLKPLSVPVIILYFISYAFQ